MPLLVLGWQRPEPLFSPRSMVWRLLVSLLWPLSPTVRAIAARVAADDPHGYAGRVLEGPEVSKVRRPAGSRRARLHAGEAMSEHVAFLPVMINGEEGWLEALHKPNEFAYHSDANVRAAYHIGVLRIARKKAILEGYVV